MQPHLSACVRQFTVSALLSVGSSFALVTDYIGEGLEKQLEAKGDLLEKDYNEFELENIIYFKSAGRSVGWWWS